MERLVTTMTEHEVTIPTSLELLNSKFIKDSSWLDLEEKFKLVITIPKEHCTSCRISAHELIDSLLNIFPSSTLAPMVILDGPNQAVYETALETIDKFQLAFPIYSDNSSQLFMMNPFIPDHEIFHSFLLDKNNMVVLIGDPSTDYNMMKLYQDVLSGYLSNENNLMR